MSAPSAESQDSANEKNMDDYSRMITTALKRVADVYKVQCIIEMLTTIDKYEQMSKNL